ncbi:c2 domain-containing protein [Anaeramoeba flamelloides]|uniref:C2 domain-containing protein n=1 Tax=Anaeramoeba flamelloides TaxID=1746091 RepID=A0AAV8A2F8_9EUKA|nr:c2 domain-containing protein [Anaeramoeba flamelloides]
MSDLKKQAKIQLEDTSSSSSSSDENPELFRHFVVAEDSDEENGFEGTLQIQIIKATNLPKPEDEEESDPYVVLQVTEQCKTASEFKHFYTHKTRFLRNTQDPVWNESPYNYTIKHKSGSIIFFVYDYDFLKKDTLLGVAKFPLKDHPEIFENKILRKKIKIKPSIKNTDKKKGEESTITFKVSFKLHNTELSQLVNEIKECPYNRMQFKLFQETEIEELLQKTRRWLNHAKKYGIRVIKMMNGNKQNGDVWINIWYSRIDIRTGKEGFLFKKNLI